MACFLAISYSLSAQSPITLNSNFEDWATAQSWTSSTGGGNINKVAISHTSEWVYFYIKTTNEVALDEFTLPNSIQLVLDFDNDPSTGSNYQGLGLGAELVIDLPSRSATLFSSSGNPSGPEINSLGFHISPTYSAFEFELALDRSLVNIADGDLKFVWYETFADRWKKDM